MDAEIHIRVHDGMKQWYKDASKDRGISMSAYIKWVLAEHKARNEDK